MNKLQQDIYAFHEKLKPVLQKILLQYDKAPTQKIYQTIIIPCRKLIQKCSFKSVSDTSHLCALAYWLYIHGDSQPALTICELCHKVDFSFEFTHWNCGIQNIYGLEIRIARELLGENRKNQLPPELIEYYFSKKVRKSLKYPQILRKTEIATCSSKLLDTELLLALYHMIGHGETGLYTELNENWQEIEQTINLYIDCLKND